MEKLGKTDKVVVKPFRRVLQAREKQNGSQVMVKLKSRALAECVMYPEDIMSAPVLA